MAISSVLVFVTLISKESSDTNSISTLSNSILEKVLISHSKVASMRFKKVVLLEPLLPIKILICS